MTYEAWRISYQSSEQAARAAYAECVQLHVRIEALEKERDALRLAVRHEADCVDAAKAEIEALRAKIEAMEKQKPVGTTEGMPGTTGFTMACFHADKVPIGSKLYALPGAKGEDK